MTVAVVIFLVLLGALAVFQISLALGAPWGRFAWGGQHEGVLPRGYRIASAVTPFVYVLMAVIALDRASVIDVVPDAVSGVGMWVIFAFFVLGVLMNAISRSKHERYSATPVAIVLAVAALFLAIGGAGDEPMGESHPGFPSWVTPAEQEEIYHTTAGQPVAWIDGDRLTLVTFGSSSCPEDVTAIDVPDAATVVVTLRGPGGACTDDLAARTHEVTLPRPVTERPATVRVNPGSDWLREAVV